MLYQPDIPQNAGNIARTCVAIGAKLWFVRPLGFRIDEKAIRRAAMDYWQHLTWEAVDDWQQIEENLDGRTFWFLTNFAEKLVWEATFSVGDVLVFGSESRGLPDALRESNQEQCLKLPMTDKVRSLNLASTMNTVAYEAIRQLGGLHESL